MRKMKITLLALLASISLPLFAVDYIEDGTNITADITAKAFDRYDGSLYVGSATATAYSISKAGRADTSVTGIGAAATIPLTGQMAIASTDGTAADYVAYKKSNDNAAGAVSAIPAAGGTEFGTTLNQIVNAVGAAATNIGLLRGGYYDGSAGAAVSAGAYFFVRSRAHLTEDFTANGGIHALLVTEGTPNTFTTIGTNTDANAVTLDGVVDVGDNGSPLKAGTGPLAPAANIVNDMYWDPRLKTLFTASTLLTTVATDEIMAISKVKFQDVAAAKLIISNTYAEDKHPAADNGTTIFAALDAAARQPISLLKIRTMYTSTGNDYLIVNGGNGAVAAVGNKFWALRYDDATGYVCANDSTSTALVDGFKLTGVAADLDGGNVGSLTIGGGDAPWAAANAATDMEVVGDTVYVSIDQDRTATVDPGVWASTAMFDKDGVIIGWTSWERVMPSDGVVDNEDITKFFAVDGVTGKLWTVNNDDAGGNPREIRRSNWLTTGFDANSLPGKLETTFAANTYSDITCVLDIPAKTPGISVGTANAANDVRSMSVFGGYETVVFAVTSRAQGANAIEKPTADFSDDQPAANLRNYLATTLTDAGTVRSLATSRNIGATHGYFFAGTDTGLWLFGDSANAYRGYPANVAIVAADNAGPFQDATDFAWTQFGSDDISGPVTAIDSDGVYLYLIEQDTSSSAGTITSKLWRITIGADLATMEATAVVVAQSGKDGIPSNTIFTDFKFLTDEDGERATNATKCILSTDRGLFIPGQALKDYTDATVTGDNPNGLVGQWLLKAADVVFPSGSLFAPKRVPADPANDDGVCHKVVSNGLFDANSLNRYQSTKLTSWNANLAMTGDFIGNNDYTNGSMATGTTTLSYLNNRALSFWTDGGRRLYTRRNVDASYGNESTFAMIQSLPYNGNEWNMTEPYGDDDIQGQTIYWIESISGLGIILAGTPNGVIALQ